MLQIRGPIRTESAYSLVRHSGTARSPGPTLALEVSFLVVVVVESSSCLRLRGRTAVLHDRPPAHFHRALPAEAQGALERLSKVVTPRIPPSFDLHTLGVASTSAYTASTPRPAFLVSSTSWTADENFTPLLSALDTYQAAINSGRTLPRLFFLITGKGALRASFERQVALRENAPDGWKGVCARCAFLSARDYPAILGSADLGVSVHSSSSGMDLPMKVVDMFGCGTPVLAKGFEALGELVKDGMNGRIWNTPEDLGKQLIVSHTFASRLLHQRWIGYGLLMCLRRTP